MKKTRKVMVSTTIESDLLDMMDEAIKASGQTRAFIFNTALRKHLTPAAIDITTVDPLEGYEGEIE